MKLWQAQQNDYALMNSKKTGITINVLDDISTNVHKHEIRESNIRLMIGILALSFELEWIFVLHLCFT